MASDPADSPGEAPTIDIRSPDADGASPDSFDEVLKRVVAAPRDTTRYEIAPGTVISNRFRIDRVLGAGGMGTVYAATDQTLGRAVAIKLHHAASGAIRLRREAVAMARLAHPNVVTVFEVGELERHPYVVMEYVTGTTLRAWLAAAPRTVPEILAMMIAAGEGLAAAHEAGLIHRDVKPENVLIGSDGRARVGDFGLARDLDSKDDPVPASADWLLSPMTQTGSVLGTPAYMAPEQLAGAVIDARADQFAFCITVWEALWGERPFASTTFEELSRALESGQLRAPPPLPKVPLRVRAALERGLLPDPARRFPTMHALLGALREPIRKRRRLLAVSLAAAAVIVGGVGWVAIDRRDRAPAVSCTDAGAALAAQAPRELPAKLRAAGAADAADRVQAQIDGFANGLAGGARTACQAGKQRREWSAELVAKSESCLDVAARSARALLAIETVTAAGAPDIVRRVNRTLPDLVSCTSPTYLAASPPVPTDPAQLEAVITARTDVAIARTELEVHAIDRARPHLARLASSPVRTSPLVAPGIAVVDGMLAYHHGELAKAEKLLADAYYAARAADDDLITSVALGQLLMMTTEKAADDPASRSWLRITVADAERLSARAPWLAARMYVAAARVADATGDSPGALRHLERARALAPAGDPVIVQGWLVEAGVLMWTGKVAEGIALYDRALALEIERLGADHPDVGQILSDYAASLIAANREDDALAVAKRALAIVLRSADPDDRLVDDVRVNVAAVLIEVGETEPARALLETARANYIAHDGVRNSKVANVDNNLALLLLDDGKPEQAIVMLDESLATTEQLLGADRTEVAEVLFNLAVAHRAKGDLEAALAAARRCADIYGAKRPGIDRHRTSLAMVATIANQSRDHATALAATETALGFPKPPEDLQSTAWPQLERARALIALKRKAEARPLLAAARASYATIGLPKRVEEIDRLLAQTR